MALVGRASSGWKSAPGTWRIVFARWALYVLAMVPGVMAMSADLKESVSSRPFFHDLGRPLDFLGLQLVLAELPGAGLGLLFFGAFAIWLLQQGWLAGATRLLDPSPKGKLPVRWEMLEEGLRYLARFLRIAALALVATLFLLWAIGAVFSRLSAWAEVHEWSVEASFIDLNLWRLALILFGMTFIGTVAFWAKVISAADDRRYVRRLPWILIRLFVKRPVASLLYQMAVVGLVLGLQASALWSWRQSTGGLMLWLPLWLMLLFLASYVWQARVRSALLVWRGGDMALLRATPDSPWYMFSRGFRALRRPRRPRS